MRAAVIASPSMSAAGDPVSGSNATITAWCVGRSVLRGKSDTSFVVRAPAPGRYAGHDGEQPVPLGDEGRDPRRHRGASGGEIGERGRDRGAKGVRIEERLDLALVQNEHRADARAS